VRGSRTSRAALKILRKAAKERGFVVEQPTKGSGKSLGKGSHEAWALCDNSGRELARSLFPQHPGDMTWYVTRSIEEAFEEHLGKGWLDK
jgi:hypothetical protein